MAYPIQVDRLTFKSVMVEEFESVKVDMPVEVKVEVDVLEKEKDDGHVQKLCYGSGNYGEIFIHHLPAIW